MLIRKTAARPFSNLFSPRWLGDQNPGASCPSEQAPTPVNKFTGDPGARRGPRSPQARILRAVGAEDSGYFLVGGVGSLPPTFSGNSSVPTLFDVRSSTPTRRNNCPGGRSICCERRIGALSFKSC
jgi:hypothetical protein